MSKIQVSGQKTPQQMPHPSPWDEEPEVDLVPLTRDEVATLKKTWAPVSLLQILGWQVLSGAVLVVLAWITGRTGWVASVLHGCLSAILPAAVFAVAMTSGESTRQAHAMLPRFFVWEAAKLLLTVAMLFMASKWVADLSWPMMLAAFLVMLKVYWVVAWRQSVRGNVVGKKFRS